MDQLRMTSDLSEEEIDVGEFIIGNTDDNGYLQATIEEMAEMTKVK